ncbi:L-rhamnose-binding lectin CSL1-like [Corythoichthys intestinalis]|uniref:L-rhamnose-binding lectin CSL1-like n=1 Tax=Corythoichthys intestinalis TaxID=161448 RepID=UPI0025A63235|nr:L-rhamnose-binding lectin CSL1-like [Corythoichthys intestinalis]
MHSFVRFCSALALVVTASVLLAGAEKMTTCDSHHLNIHHLHCETGVIQVEHALYGRTSSAVCAAGRPPWQLANTHCARPGTLKDMRTRCNDKKTCDVNTRFFRKPDPCYGTFKYLQTIYTCQPAFTVVACEDSLAHLSCDKGLVIRVYSANYGRRDRKTCVFERPWVQVRKTKCVHPTEYVPGRCNGKNKCTILASNSVFGDPCRGTYKYLEISYTCEPLVVTASVLLAGAEQMTTCDSHRLNIHHLHCEDGVIQVEQAMYGRSSLAVCAAGRPPRKLANTQCARPGTLEDIRTRCNGKKTCDVNTRFFRKPDPCRGTFKYLQTNYTCYPAFTVVACQDSLAHLFCDKGLVIRVYGADYGRRDRNTCVLGRPWKQVRNTECLHPTEIVPERCNGKNKCTILASNSVFGDPCRGTYKYLEVSYTCECKTIIL